MEHPICQSCGTPLFEELKGSNRDSSKNEQYCINCFANGEFTDQSLSLHDMEVKLLEMAEVHDQITLEEAEQIIKILPTLKRWQMSNI